MGVKKFQSVKELPPPPSFLPLDPDNLRIACELTELSFLLRPWVFETGVKRFRNIEEASRYRQNWETSQVRKFHKNTQRDV